MNKALFFIILNLCLVLQFTGCTFLIKSDQKDEAVELIKLPQTEENPQVCSRSSYKIQYSGGSNYFQAEFNRLLKQTKNENLTVREKFLMGVMIMMQFRPDQFSHSSRIQFFQFSQAKAKYSEIYQNPKQSLLDILQPLGSLEKIQILLSKHALAPKVGPDLKENLALVQKNLMPEKFSKSPLTADAKESTTAALPPAALTAPLDLVNTNAFEKYFMRGENLVITGEGLKTFNVLSYLRDQKSEAKKLYSKPKQVIPTPIFRHESGIVQADCNVDMKLYENWLQIISDGTTRPAILAVSSDSEFYFISSIQEFSQTEIHPRYPTISSRSMTRPVPVCWNSNGDQFQFAGASYSRDMGQVLHGALNLGLLASKTKEQAIEVINFPRSLLLYNPPRLLVEQSANESKLVDQYYNFKMPIYGVKQIGRILFAGNFTADKSIRLVGDKRAQEHHVQCY